MIRRKLKRSSALIGGVLVIAASCTMEDGSEKTLPILGNRDVVYSTVDGKEVADTLYHTVREFEKEFINQDSIVITKDSLSGKVWITNFFFTSCPSICPPMITQMKRLNENLSDLDDEIVFVSFSIDPERDTPSRFRSLIHERGITAKNWQFLTGDEAYTHLIGNQDYFVSATNDKAAPGGFAHGDTFTLVDREGRVRGIYKGTIPEEVDSLERDVRKLLRIEYGISSGK